jgi:hypothetical protein
MRAVRRWYLRVWYVTEVSGPLSVRRHSALCLPTVLLALVLGACAPSPGSVEPEGSAAPARTRLLTAEQYTNAIAGVFGEDIAASVFAPVPPLARTDGLLASGAAFVGLTSDQISQIQLAATAIAAQVVDEEHRYFLLPCAPASPSAGDATCARSFLAETGRLLQRRPLAAERLDELVDISVRAGNETEDFHEGLALALEALLISPEFLFIVDRTEPDPARPGAERLDGHALASRLSFFLWNAPPDAVLLDAAATGALHTVEGRTEAVDRMLASPRLEVGLRAFFDDMLAFDDFDSLAKDPQVYPMVTGATLRDAREQTLRTVIDHVLVREADYRDLFTTRRTFMSMPLAAVYGTPSSQGWVEHEFDEGGARQGLLTHVSFLAANSHAVRSSPTLRGKALRELFLCQKVPDPPPNVDFSLLEDAGDVPTARERLSVHNTNPSCAGCHLITDPMGLSLENFDGAGRFRETENGAELDITGELDGVFYDDIAGLTTAMRDHPKLPYCLVNRLYAYGTGGPVSLRHDRDVLSYFEERFVDSEHRVPALLRELALSDAFATVRPSPTASTTVAETHPTTPIGPHGVLEGEEIVR